MQTTKLRTCRPLWVCAAVLLAGLAPVRADVVHLKRGGTVSGQIIATEESGYRIRTLVGVVFVARENVARIEAGETPFEEYDRRLEATQAKRDTPAGWFALAEWCATHEMQAERRRHLERVLELDTNHAGARAALGYVKVGDVWVDGSRPTSRPAEPPVDPVAEAEAAHRESVRAIQGDWARRIRAIKSNMLDAGVSRIHARGRERILAITDPLAILPLTQVLSDGNVATRSLLVEVLGQFAEDEAILNLTAIALVDGSSQVRRRALGVLARGGDPRVPQQVREALKSDSDVLIKNASQALQVLRDPGAVPELIRVLTARRNKLIEVPVQRYFGAYPATFSRNTSISVGGQALSVTPALGVDRSKMAVGVFEPNRYERHNVTMYRTDVLDALKAITGQNFGFDAEAWRRWYQEQAP